MSVASRLQLKDWFKTGLKPLQAQYHAWIDSFLHVGDSISMSQIDNLDTTLQNLVTIQQFNTLGNALIPISISNIQLAQVSVGIGKLLEVVVVEVTGLTSVVILYDGKQLVLEEISETTTFRLDCYMEVSDIYISTSSVINVKIYSR